MGASLACPPPSAPPSADFFPAALSCLQKYLSGERANDNYEMYSVEDSKRVYNAKPIAAVTFNSTL